ncbi:MAG: glycosyltransferase family 4 protein, partial [Acidimicrobiaceae bacterium]|nr:glycosyltransferase family 4 protein [Acidimicrobiaceae bacterium]
ECSVACVPSLYEGFSLPAIEAMSSAAPLVVTNGGALPEVVGEDGVGALVVETGNPDALAAALGRVLDDPEYAEQLGANARARVLENWSWHHTALRTIEQYELLLDEYYATPRSKIARPFKRGGQLPEGAVKAQKLAAEARARAAAEQQV